jgi:hypothetical protein
VAGRHRRRRRRRRGRDPGRHIADEIAAEAVEMTAFEDFVQER